MDQPTLILQVGNSRMKWGVIGPRGWLAQGVLPNADIGTLALRDWQNLPRPASAVGVNAGGEPARVRVESQLARWRLSILWLVAQERGGGVVNRYRPASQLSGDRWALLVAARRRVLASAPSPAPCVAVNAGTVVTIDALDGNGVFLGGLIVPGPRLMLQSIADRTVALKMPPGRFHKFPTNTPDALASGAAQAVCGAVELMRARLRQDAAAVRCYVTGGAAHEIAAHLTGPLEVVDNLVLEGVLALAAEHSGT
ncbi:MAG TPA: type III pantothenate kinase [Casimicrobiaceae bacterium]|nr:type III pantothenate kinase [Casimicrobiaceae bacterium]